MPASFQCGDHVVDDLGEPGVVGDEVAVDGSHSAGFGGVGVAEIAVCGVVHVKHRSRALCDPVEFELSRAVLGCWGGCGDGVSYRAELQRDQIVELVATIGGRGETKPAASGDLLDGVLEGGGGNVVALVHDDQPVATGEILDVSLAG